MDPAVAYLTTLGLTPGQATQMKQRDRLRFIASHFGIIDRIPAIPKKDCRLIMRRFLMSEKLNRQSFESVLYSGVAERFAARPHCPDEHEITICNLPAAKFYQSAEWKKVRYRTLHHHGNKCQACGRGPKDRAIIHVDHILPRSIYPEHALSPNNLQVLCDACNTAKSNIYEDDWRKR